MMENTEPMLTGANALEDGTDSTAKEMSVFLLTALVAGILALNAFFAYSAYDGSRILGEVAAGHGVAVSELGLGEHYAIVNAYYHQHPLMGTSLYHYEWFGLAWAAICVVPALALAWVWRRRGWLIATLPFLSTAALTAIVFANWPAVSKIANWLN